MFVEGLGLVLLGALLVPFTRGSNSPADEVNFHGLPRSGQIHQCDSSNKSVHEFSFRNAFKNETINMTEYRGKVLVLINVASF